ncbi:MAG: aspartate aminotransferase family protein, partial [Pseudomonadota bacterium]
MNAQAPNTAKLQALDREHYLHPFTDHKALAARGTRVITSADGVWLTDSDGERIFDAMSGLWCVNLGYGRRELAEAAYRQMLELPFYNSFFQTAHPPAIELGERLAGLAQPHLNRVFYTGSGSEANDTVVRMVRRYWDLTGARDKHTIISRHNAYHGSTVAAASLGGMKPMHAQGGLPIPGVEHIDQPYWFAYDGPLDEADFGLAMARQLEAKIDELGEDRVAAFIAEPVQGAGGVIVPPDSYWPEIRRICRERDVLLVVDEVICGFGRTGEWFGSDYYGVEPDLMPIAKGLSSGYLPIGGVMVSDRVADVLIDAGGEFYHGFTYSGHPAACAVALANIELMKAEGIVERVRDETGPYLQKRWRELAGHGLVGEARGLGFLGAIELVADPRSGKRFDAHGTAGTLCRDICFANGLVMRAVDDTMIIA